MDPNHWNTYNIQYGHSPPGGIPSAHPSLARIDLTSGIGLSHTLQTSHGSLGGRPVSAIPTVSYPGLGMNILDPLSAGISASQTHKTMSLAPQLVFEQQVRGSDQQSASIGRYDGSKGFRTDSMSRDSMMRNQLLEAAAARVLSSSNFTSSPLYNQFGSVLSDVAATTMSQSTGSGGGGVSKSSQPHMHDPPPAHSSARLNSIQRNPHTADLLYARCTETLIPTSLSQISSLYSSVPFGKQGANQQLSHHRQTPVHTQQGFSSSSDIEDLSSNSQNQLYSSYANLAVAESQDFSATQLSGDISYEAVSPAPPMNESSQNNSEHSSFSIVHFPELVNLTAEHAHSLADKFQENDFRLKLDSRLQQHQQESMSVSHQSHRQEMAAALKLPKDASNFHSSMLSMQSNQRGGQFHPIMSISPSLSQINSSTVNISQSSSLIQSSLATMAMSMQQNAAPISVQAPADSTTKPKRSRSRKKKGDTNISPAASQPEENKKSSPTHAFASTVQQHNQLSHHTPILNMPLSSQHISTLPMGSHVSHNSPVQQQQNFRNHSSNQFTSRDVQRAHTPSIPQTYSIQDQSHGYAPAQSPKLSHQNVVRSQSEFALPTNVPNEKSIPSSCKQQKKSGQSTPKNNSNQMFRSNIPDNQQHIQNFASHAVHMVNAGQQRGSPMQDARSGAVARMQNFDNSQQQKISCQMSPIGQPSPQGNMGSDNSGFSASKIGNSSHIMNSGLLGSQPPVSHSPMDSRPVSVEPTAMSHAYEQSHSSGLIDAHDSGHFHIDFTGQPFLEQLVGVQPPMTLPPTSYSHTGENGEVVFTTLVTPAENARLQQHDSTSSDNFRPTYHGEPVHEIQPIGPIGSHLGIEDVSFNTFFDNQREIDQGSMSVAHHGTPEPERMNLTFVPHLVEDDELGHFSQMAQPVSLVKKEPHDPGPKPPLKDSFQGSFLNYLQGHKQETLSSVSSSAVTKKPQLPKYIPEPRRPKPTVTVPSVKENLHFSDAEDSLSTISGKVKDLISSLSDNDNSSQKSESDREGYSVQRTSELAVKITLPKNKKRNKFGPFAEMTHLKDRSRDKDGQLKRKRKRGKHHGSEGEDFMPGQKSDEETISPETESLPKERSPPPKRTSIGRKAKDRCMEKTKRHDTNSGSDSSSDESLSYLGKGKVAYKSDGSERDYDSDKDPVWMPFEMDLKQGHDFDDKRKRTKRPRTRGPSTKSGKSSGSHKSSLSGGHTSSGNPGMVRPRRPSHTVSTGDTAPAASTSAGESLYKTGTFVIEKKDMQNYEHYPIWQLDQGNMMQKFEVSGVSEDGAIRHHAVETFSTWMPSMESQFVQVKVLEIPNKGKEEPVTVQVQEEFRPKAPAAGRLELQYEDDPLVEPFNIYLQVFLSQALVPTFLSAIFETNEKFYVDVLNQIDEMIEAKCREITKLAHWKLSFQEHLHMCPLMKEIDRPNLKQACQASENSSPPTIKSVLLSGHAYDRCLLTETPMTSSDVAQEFMIGKVAAYYVRPYHSLYHFKYWLHQRCEAKVKMMKDSNKSENLNDEVILDKCLENRSWVLQLFDSLKSLLKYGGDATR